MRVFILTFFVLLAVALSEDVCGNGICEPTENVYWCSKDCSGTCGDQVCSRDEPLSSCSDCECAETKEEKLGRIINAYRATAGLPSIPIGEHITTVARVHVRDSAMSKPDVGECNLHSWSNNTFDGYKFSSCCYTPDHKEAQCIWDKPKELTPLQGSGYEISAWGYGTVEDALRGWQNSNGHNSMIMNLGIWATIEWKFMGVGVSNFESNWYHVWFYANQDDTVKPTECSEVPSSTSPIPSVAQETASSSPLSSTIPMNPSPTPSASTSSSTVSPGTLDCTTDDQLFRLSMVHREKKNKNNFSNLRELWSGRIADISDPTTMIVLPTVPISMVTDKTKKGMIRFESCSSNIIVRYYDQDSASHGRRKRRKVNANTHMAYDNLKRVIKKVFKKKANKKWIAGYLRMEIWVGKDDMDNGAKIEQSVTFRVSATE